MLNKQIVTYTAIGLTAIAVLTYTFLPSEPMTVPSLHQNGTVIGTEDPNSPKETLPVVEELFHQPFLGNTTIEDCRQFLKDLEASDRNEYIFEYEKEFDMVWQMIRCGIPIAFLRMADGEKWLMKGEWIRETDGWGWSGGPSKLGAELLSAATCYDDNFYIGLPCEDWENFVNELFAMMPERKTRYLSYATLFINKNYRKFRTLFDAEIINDWKLGRRQRKVIVVGNVGTQVARAPWADHIEMIPNDGARVWEHNITDQIHAHYTELARNYTHATFFMSVVHQLKHSLT